MNKIEESITRLENLVVGMQKSVVRNAEAIELLRQQIAKKADKPKEVKKNASKRSTKKSI